MKGEVTGNNFQHWIVQSYSWVWLYYPMLLCLSYFGLSFLCYFLLYLASLEKNMAPDQDFLKLEISECFLPAIWHGLSKQNQPYWRYQYLYYKICNNILFTITFFYSLCKPINYPVITGNKLVFLLLEHLN